MRRPFRRTLWSVSSVVLAAAALDAAPALACGPESYMGMICTTSASFCPNNTLPVDGRLLSISQYNALFALLGTNYGGDGRVTFGLPDLRGRAPLGIGTGPGLTPVSMGMAYGAQQVTLTPSQLPVHTHPAIFTPTGGGGLLSVSMAVQAAGTAGSDNATAPSGTYKYLSASGAGPGAATIWNKDLTNPVALGGVNVTATGGGITGGTVMLSGAGGSQPFSTQSPALGLTMCIVSEGLWPPRD